MRKIFCLVLLVFIAFTTSAFSTINITTYGNIAISSFPDCSLTLSADKDGKEIELTKDNIVIQEIYLANLPTNVVKNANGTYTVSWKSKLKERFEYADLFITAEDEVGIVRTNYPKNYNLPQVKIFTPTALPTVYFNKPDGPTEPNQQIIEFQPQLLTNTGYAGSGELNFWIDSIKTQTPDFTFQYFGGYMNDSMPPFIAFGSKIKLFLLFRGMENRLYTDKLTIYFNGGQKEEVDLIANTYTIPTKTMLHITNPKPGEILTPCFKDTITWTGANPKLETFIDFSTNGGITWQEIGHTDKSYWEWIIPKDITEEATIRVYQKYKQFRDATLKNSSSSNLCNFAPAADFIIASADDGMLREWDIKNPDINGTPIGEEYKLREFDLANETSLNVATVYTEISDAKREFASIYSGSLVNQAFRTDTIAFFESGKYSPIEVIDLKFKVKQAVADPKFRWLAVLPELNNQIILYSTKDKKIERTIKFDKPVRAFSFVNGRDTLAVALQSNEVIIYDLKQMKEVDKRDFSNLPLMDKVAYAPDGNLLAFTTILPPSNGNNTSTISQISQTQVYEMTSSRLVRSYYAATSLSIGIEFNPLSNKLIRASQLPEYINIYNLSKDMPSDTTYSFEGGNLRGFDYAPEGTNLATINSYGLLLKTFSLPESVKMDSTFSIRYTDVEIKSVLVSDRFIDTKLSDTLLTTNFCNTGELPLLFDQGEFKFMFGRNFKMSPMALPDTLFPGECLNIAFTYNPIDTGLIVDTLILKTCAQTFFIPFQSKGLPRNIQFYSEVFDFGEVCIGSDKPLTLKIFKNLDPVPLNINFVYFSGNVNNPFTVTSYSGDTTIGPGEDYYATVKYTPTIRGLDTANLNVNHSKQIFMVPSVKFQGVGLGSDVEISHTNLYFIPEIKHRKITIKNLENTNISIEGFSVTPLNTYNITTQLPKLILPGKEIEIDIECLTDNIVSATLTLQAKPCIAQALIKINQYVGTSAISILDVEADPREMTSIKIQAINTENAPYKGDRYYESEIAINPAIFIPETDNPVRTNYGTAKLLRNEIVNGKRLIGFRVDGDFPLSGIIAEIHGYAGLTDPSSSPITFSENQSNFGTNVISTTKNGTFKLINLCGDKMLIPENKLLKVQSISPNPVTESFNLGVNSEISGKAEIEIYDNMGVMLLKMENMQINKGGNTLLINSSYLGSGTYKGIIKMDNSIVSFAFIVVK